MEEEPSPKDKGEYSGPEELAGIPTEDIVTACQDVLPQEDLQDIAAMEPEEAYIYLLSNLPEFGIDDPDAFLTEKGLQLGFRPLNEDERAQHTGDYLADEIDYEQ